MSKPLVIVSGLPRSGTSLMMAALSAAGLPLISDQSRAPDQHNPKGYFEDDRVLKLAEESGWLHGQEGKGVKILSHLLQAIPRDVQARVLFMRRPLPQVLASQNAMLGADEDVSDLVPLVARDLAATLLWLEQQPHLSTLEVFYTELLKDPRAGFQKVIDFVGARGEWDLEAMVATVDPSLHRQR